MKANLNVFCPPKPRFSVGDCVLYSDDIYDDVPYVYTYRSWGRFVVTGSTFVPMIVPHAFYKTGWWYTGILFDSDDDATIGHDLSKGEMIPEADIRPSKSRPSDGFLAFFGLLWLSTDDASIVLGISPKTLKRKRVKLDEGSHYIVSGKSYIWDIGKVANALGIKLEAPEVERANRGRESRGRYKPLPGLFSVPTPDRPSIIVPSVDVGPPLCG